MKTRGDNLNYDDIYVDSCFSFRRTIRREDVLMFAKLTGDYNPLHVDNGFATESQFGRRVVHGMLTSSLFSTLVGMYCPGENSLYLSQSLQFKSPLFYGDTATVIGTVISKVEAIRLIKLKTEVYRDNDLIVTGEAQVKVL